MFFFAFINSVVKQLWKCTSNDLEREVLAGMLLLYCCAFSLPGLQYVFWEGVHAALALYYDPYFCKRACCAHVRKHISLRLVAQKKKK